MKKSQGFTIVELLIVIVVIAILAAIIIVAYQGVTARANTSAALATATLSTKKAEAYNADIGNYPITFGTLTGAASTTPYRLNGVASITTLANTTPTNTINFEVCGSGTPANLAAITTSNVVGIRAVYHDYTGAGSDITRTAGTTTGAGITCFDSLGSAT
jgi:prepilin-type N-terminal cleavage/methylation domain-containing protein